MRATTEPEQAWAASRSWRGLGAQATGDSAVLASTSERKPPLRAPELSRLPGGPAAAGAVVALAMDSRRRVELEGCWNFRDIGGYPTRGGHSLRWGRLFRSDGLQDLTPGDLDRLRALGIATVVDLRTSREREYFGSFPGDRIGAEYHHIPLVELPPSAPSYRLIAESGSLPERYRKLLDVGGRRLVAVIELLAGKHSQPAVFHCTAGKDRTGLVAAMLLALLDVPETFTLVDYALSKPGAARLRQAFARGNRPFARAMAAHPSMSEVDPSALAIVLNDLRAEHGPVGDYLHGLGLSEADLLSLRSSMLETAES